MTRRIFSIDLRRQLAELSVEEKHVLGLIRKSEFYKPALLLDVWRALVANQQAGLHPLTYCSRALHEANR